METAERLPAELSLFEANQCLQEAEATDEVYSQALRHLRKQAIDEGQVEAKTKLSLVYSDPDSKAMHDPSEAQLWSQSIFDKTIGQALVFCRRPLLDSHHTKLMRQVIFKDDACAYLAGIVVTRGVGVEADVAAGVHFLEKAAATATHSKELRAAAAYELGCILGDHYVYSWQEPDRALEWFQKAAELGDTRAFPELTHAYYNKHNDQLAFRYAHAGASDRYCQYVLGRLYSQGRGAAIDMNQAVKFLTCSAQQGFEPAIEELAALYLQKQDYQEAFHWCTKGSHLQPCQIALGDLFRNGYYVNRDHQKAFNYYQQAAAQPDSPSLYAQHMLGEM